MYNSINNINDRSEGFYDNPEIFYHRWILRCIVRGIHFTFPTQNGIENQEGEMKIDPQIKQLEVDEIKSTHFIGNIIEEVFIRFLFTFELL